MGKSSIIYSIDKRYEFIRSDNSKITEFKTKNQNPKKGQ
jgi:hypothetical protein